MRAWRNGSSSLLLAVALSGCGLVHVSVNGRTSGQSPSQPQQQATPGGGASPRTAQQAQTANASTLDYSVIARQEAADQEAARQQQAALRNSGSAVGDRLKGLTQESAAIPRADTPNALLAAGVVGAGLEYQLAWCLSEDGQSYRQILEPQELAAWDKQVASAKSEAARLNAMLPQREDSTASSRGPSGGSRGSGTRGSGEDLHSACVARCQRGCPSPSGSGEEWERSNADYSQCMNEISSCQIGCP